MTRSTGFTVRPANFAQDCAHLLAVRERVFVHEQGVPIDLEQDEADPHCLHVLAVDADGTPIGTGRLVPPFQATNGCAGAAQDSTHTRVDALPRIGRMAVLREWRDRGVGEAVLSALTDLARDQGWQALALNAQASAMRFYSRLGYLPHGERFVEAGIEHQQMRRRLDGAGAIASHQAAIATLVALAHQTRRRLYICTHALDPGLFDAPDALDALRRLAVRGGGIAIRVLLHDATTPQREQAPLLALAQRLPSIFALRETEDPADRAYPSAFIANDAGGYYFRRLDQRIDGEVNLDGAARARQLREEFERLWERSRPCTELRVLGV